jgi:ATP-dependent DNA helicase RecG
MQDFLDQPLAGVIGGKSAKALGEAFDIGTVNDLLRHYPRRYAEQGRLTGLESLVDGENVTVVAEIAHVTSRRMRNKRGSILEARVTDGRDSLRLTFFNQAWRERELRVGRSGLFSGTISSFRGTRQLAHPRYLLFPDGIHDDPEAAEAFASALIPVYPASSRVTTWEIARAVRVLVDTLPDLADPIPDEVRRERGLVDLRTALVAIHRPTTLHDAEQARTRLIFEEALLLQAAVVRRRALVDRWTATPRSGSSAGLVATFDESLPFELTPGQRAVGDELAADLARSRPMQRLLQGDVGSGKTVVALRAMLDVVDSGGQAALLAPTEVLAHQHAQTMRQLLGPLASSDTLDVADLSRPGTRVCVLTGSLKGRARADALASIADGSAGIVVGTHALLEENVDFADLGLAVIDEQHRFGVEQRARLGERENGGRRPHVLVMTATPIPRTVVMTVFGDLDVSTLTDLPQGRAEVTTHVVDPSTQPKHYERVWDRVAEEAAQGNRVFVVCPRIGEGLDSPSEQPADMEPADMEEGESGMHGVIEFASWLATRCPNLRIGTLHGRMSSDEKEAVMTRFRGTQSDALDVLVATTVIEVGVDVPQASMMVVMDAERFGISQLHQLRGRIGRGSIPGVCILVSRGQGVTRTRLDAVAATRDGFVLAQHDVELRGAGDVLGAAQSGLKSSLRLLDVLHDVDVIRDARGVAESLIGDDPELSGFDTLRVALDRADTERLAFLERA